MRELSRSTLSFSFATLIRSLSMVLLSQSFIFSASSWFSSILSRVALCANFSHSQGSRQNHIIVCSLSA